MRLLDSFGTTSDVVVEAIFEHDGVVDKFLGDEIMALFGIREEDNSGEGRHGAERALRAACANRDNFEPVKLKWMRQWRLVEPREVDIGLGCGIHTGEALVGDVGAARRSEFTALGGSELQRTGSSRWRKQGTY